MNVLLSQVYFVRLAIAEGGRIQLIQTLFSPNNLLSFVNSAGASYDPNKPKAALNYVLYDQQMQVVQEFKGSIQVDGEGTWSKIGTDGALTIPRGGYLAVFLTNGSSLPVYFDDFRIRFTKGIVREETHYYPHGLPMGFIGGAAIDAVENRHTHQGNEYRKDAGLNWMDFNFRQYDPQIGRFLSVDPLADYYGQDRYSPYAAMGNQPESTIDPNGLIQTNDAETSANIDRIRGIVNENWRDVQSRIFGFGYGFSSIMEGGIQDYLMNFRVAFFGGASGGGGGSAGGGQASASAQATAAQADQQSTTGQGETISTAGNDVGQLGSQPSDLDNLKDEEPVVLFSNNIDDQFFHNIISEMIQSNYFVDNDKKFYVYGHGASRGLQYSAPLIDQSQGKNTEIREADEFDAMMLQKSPAYKKMIQNEKNPVFTLGIFACHSSDLAKKISEKYPKAIIYGFEGLLAFRTNMNYGINKNRFTKGGGYVVFFNNGIEIGRLYPE